MRQWRFFGLTTIILLIPVLYLYYSIGSGIFRPVMGIPFYSCSGVESCPDLPVRNYETIQLAFTPENSEIKLRQEIRKLVQVRDTIHGYHFVLSELNNYEDFINALDIGYSGKATVIHNEFGVWIYYWSKSEEEAFEKKCRKLYPFIGEPRTCK